EVRRLGLTGSPAFRPMPANAAAAPGCETFPETGHSLCGLFRDYWHGHGLEFGDSGVSYRESLALFGYPISQPFTDPASGLTVQYFERARFEYHPENAAPYDVLLGLLGNDELQAKGWIR
ncbi:MAG TPA: peptidoglycan hydrolase, partial [Nitrolancea sp.]|nr:peptidoglycan hydrolase [Nitrolancea sp.]